MVELHPLAAGEEGELEGDEEVGRKADVVGDGEELEEDVEGEVDGAEVGFGGLVLLEEHQEVEDALDFEELLELVDVDGDEDHVVVGQRLQHRDHRDQCHRVLPAFAPHVVERRHQQADYVQAKVLTDDTMPSPTSDHLRYGENNCDSACILSYLIILFNRPIIPTISHPQLYTSSHRQLYKPAIIPIPASSTIIHHHSTTIIGHINRRSAIIGPHALYLN